jgi:hypothetical protein
MAASFAFFVEEVRLFGSCLKGQEMVGDVDLAFSMMRKTRKTIETRRGISLI